MSLITKMQDEDAKEIWNLKARVKTLLADLERIKEYTSRAAEGGEGPDCRALRIASRMAYDAMFEDKHALAAGKGAPHA